MSDKESFDEVQRAIGNWGDDTFKTCQPESILNHLKREVTELVIGHYEKPCENDSEAADVLMLLIHYSHKMKFSLYDALMKKWEINKRRKWGKPDSEGVISHIE